MIFRLKKIYSHLFNLHVILWITLPLLHARECGKWGVWGWRLIIGKSRFWWWKPQTTCRTEVVVIMLPTPWECSQCWPTRVLMCVCWRLIESLSSWWSEMMQCLFINFQLLENSQAYSTLNFWNRCCQHIYRIVGATIELCLCLIFVCLPLSYRSESFSLLQKLRKSCWTLTDRQLFIRVEI